MTLASGIYHGHVRHRRKTPRAHEFNYGLYMLYLDLDELPTLFDGRMLWSHERRNLYSFRRSDYLGPADVPLDEAVRDVVERNSGTRPTGPVRMLTQLRSFGYVFNPVTFYYCFDEAGKVDSVVAEITNTPWGERHRYVLRAAGGPLRFDFGKEFHISPFMGMDVDYEWRFSEPGELLAVHMRNLEQGDRTLDVTMRLERRPFTARELARAALKHPAMTVKVVAGIYWQALRLYLKRTPFFPHPATTAVEKTT